MGESGKIRREPVTVSARVQRGKSWQQIGAQATRLSAELMSREYRAWETGDKAEEERLRALRRRVSNAALRYQANLEETYGATYSPAGFVNQNWANNQGYTPLNYYSYTRGRRTNRR